MKLRPLCLSLSQPPKSIAGSAVIKIEDYLQQTVTELPSGESLRSLTQGQCSYFLH